MTVVLGGGISGLTTAFYLHRSGSKSIRLLEASNRVGGWIKSTITKNGILFEQGPRTIRPVGVVGQNTLELVEDLGLLSEIKPIPRSHPSAKNRMIYKRNELHLLPNSLISVFKKLEPFDRPLIAALWTDLKTSPRKSKDESIYDFVERRLGKDIADYAVSPLICGICAGDAKEISVKFLMKNLFELEQRHGGIVKGILKGGIPKSKETKKLSALGERSKAENWSVWSLNKGLETLPLALSRTLKSNVDISLESTCEKIKFVDKEVQLTINNTVINADHVFCALPSHQLSNILDEKHKTLKEQLQGIPFVNVAVVNLQYDTEVLQQHGFGFLVPPCEELAILGVIFDTCSFPQDNKTVLTVMMGGKWFNQLFGENPSEEHLHDIAVKHVSNILKIKSSPSDSMVSILRNCIPQYVIGHHDRVQNARNYIAENKLPITLVGSSYDGVGINDVIYSARQGVEQYVHS